MTEKKSFFKSRAVKVIVWIIALLLLADLPWMIYRKPAYRGRVLDSEAKKPIESAVVVVEYWKHDAYGIVDTSTARVTLRETLTDSKGEFYFPSYITILAPLSWEGSSDFNIYKPGYGRYPDDRTYPPMIAYSDMPPRSPNFRYLLPESHFSDKLGAVREFWTDDELTLDGKKKVSIVMGLVELPSLKTKDERIKSLGNRFTGYDAWILPIYYKTLNEERKFLDLE